MALAAALALCGDVGRSLIEAVTGTDGHLASMYAFDLGSGAAMLVAIHAKFGSPLRYWRQLLESSILALVVGYVTLTLVVVPQFGHRLTLLVLLAAARSVVMLLAGLAAASALTTSSVRPEPGAGIIALGIPIQALASLVFASGSTTGPVPDGSWVYAIEQLGWAVAIFGAAALLIWPARPRQVHFPTIPFLGPSTTGALVALLGAVMWHSRVLASDPIGVIVAWLGIVTVLARLHLTARDRGRLAMDMQKLAETDALTGVPNRRMFDERLAEAVAAAEANGTTVAILVIDVDGFKNVNEGYGYPVGDLALRAMTVRLAASLRPVDLLARLGGEQFIAVLPGAIADSLFDVAERCRHQVGSRPFEIEGFEIPITVSIGGATFPDDARTTEDLERVADRGLYEAKQAGRNRVHVGRASSPQRQIPIPELGVIGDLLALADRLDGAQALQEHSMAMVDIAARLCAALGVTTVQRRRCLAAARLHDVGKIGTPHHILGKPGALTVAEQAVMQDHVRVGVELLNAFSTTREFAAVVAQHHERFDGSGYPAGLAGSQIGLEARIIAVADAWTAMLADRPYRAALTQEAACAELVRGSGSQFDPSVVGAFMEMLGGGMPGDPGTQALAA
jgi:diguanylate cyclase (GGDEF)-like protein/putative nucleotidyltransferase with HDIG domain